MEDKTWVGVDAGKEFHWTHALDASGTEPLSRRVENDEASLLELIDEASPSQKILCRLSTSPAEARRFCWRCSRSGARG